MMYAKKMRKLTADTENLKQNLGYDIMKQAPADRGLGFALKYSELENTILCASNYNVYAQLKRLSDYITANTERTLSTILRTLESIAENGRASTLPNTYFCSKAKDIIRSIL